MVGNASIELLVSCFARVLAEDVRAKWVQLELVVDVQALL